MSKHNDIYIFLGPPGSGKGSLSQLCIKRLGWQQLSTGNLCREHIAQQTAIGKQIDFAIKSGKLIADSLIVDMVHDWLNKRQTGEIPVIFDGFPRTLTQATVLHDFVEQLGGLHMKFVQLVLPDEEVVYRLLARSICTNKECQRVYSLHKHSPLQPTNPMACDECENPLMRRSDDEETAIYERLRVYHEHEQNMLDFFKDKGYDVHTLGADAHLEDVYAQFVDIVGV